MARKSPISVLFGRRLRALRNLRGFTQEALAERAAVTGKSVSEIERGEGNPTLDLIARLARALGVEPYMLLRFEETAAGGPTADAARGFRAADRVGQYLEGRPAEDLELVLRVLDAVLGSAPTLKR